MSQAAPDGSPLKRVESFQWPSGHVGHLSDGQRDALQSFKKLSQEKGYYSPANDDAPATHDDETLLRYLRARKFIPKDAFEQFKSTEDWRTENKIDDLYETIDADEYERTRRLYPQWTGRRDKRGVPVYVFAVNEVDPKALTAYEHVKEKKDARNAGSNKTSYKMLLLFSLYENLCRFVLPLCSAIPDRPHGETPMSQSSNIVDISGVGFAKFWSLRNHMSDASRLATAYYPETLDRIFVVGAPSFFPTVWQWAQKWFDPITVSKIFILSNKEIKSTFAQYMDMDDVPKKYGGNLDWEFGDMPAIEPSIANNLRWKEDIRQKDHRTFPVGPIKWQYDQNGDLVAIAVGSKDGQPRHQVIAGLHPEDGVARLALSPGRTTKATMFTDISGPAQSNPSASSGTETPTMANNTAETNDLTRSDDPHVPDSSRRGTATVPSKDETVALPTRQGTSHTRFEQQEDTHAEGQLADATPEVKVDGQGERTAVMEPVTVGQAPKEHPVPEPEEPQPGLVEQAQNVATHTYEAAAQLPQKLLSVVGLGGQQNASTEESTKVQDDPAVNGAKDHVVEEFLRNKTMSTAKAPETT